MLLVIAVALSLFAASSIARASGIEKFSFEPTPHVVEKGRDPQVAVRASGDLFLLRVEGQNLWLQTSSDGGDSFDFFATASIGSAALVLMFFTRRFTKHNE